MSDAIILPEMLEMGVQAFTESREQELTPAQTVIEVYLAMEGMRQVVMMRSSGALH